MHKVGISGHRTLTEPTRRAVAAEIVALLAERDQVEGWTSLAEGADTIFAWAVLAAGGELVFVRPFDGVETDFEGEALTAFEAARSLARLVALEFSERSEEAYFHAGLRVADEADEMFLVWDGKPSVGTGGTGDIADHCEQHGIPYVVIWPPGSARP